MPGMIKWTNDGMLALRLARSRVSKPTYLDENQQQNRCGCTKKGAYKESCFGSAPIPEGAHKQRRRKHSYSESEIIQPISCAALVGSNEICYQSLLSSFGKSKVDSVDQKKHPDRSLIGDKSEASIYGSVENPARNYQPLAAQTIGEVAAKNRAQDLTSM